MDQQFWLGLGMASLCFGGFPTQDKRQDTSLEVAEKRIVFDGVIFPATFFCRQHSPLSLFVATPERLEHTPALLLHHRNQLDHA